MENSIKAYKENHTWHTKCILLLLLPSLFVACSSSTPEYVQCGEVRYVEEFPINCEIKKGEGEEFGDRYNLNGCLFAYAVDSLLLCCYESGEAFWKVYPLNKQGKGIPLFPKGHGGDELVNMVVPSLLYVEGDSIFAQFTESGSDEFRIVNLTASIQTGKVAYSLTKALRSESMSYSRTHMFRDSSFVLYQIRPFQVSRMLWTGNQSRSSEWLGKYDTPSREDAMELFASINRINYNRSMIAEAMLRLNQINLFSTSECKATTLCMGNSLTNINKVATTRRNKQTKFFNFLDTHESFFTAVYIGRSYDDYDECKCGSSILFFDWEGNALAKLTLPYIADATSIVKDNLYVFSFHGTEETLRKYDISAIMKHIM